MSSTSPQKCPHCDEPLFVGWHWSDSMRHLRECGADVAPVGDDETASGSEASGREGVGR